MTELLIETVGRTLGRSLRERQPSLKRWGLNLALAVTAATSGYTGYKFYEQSEDSRILAENAEAIASSPNPGALYFINIPARFLYPGETYMLSLGKDETSLTQNRETAYRVAYGNKLDAFENRVKAGLCALISFGSAAGFFVFKRRPQKLWFEQKRWFE